MLTISLPAHFSKAKPAAFVKNARHWLHARIAEHSARVERRRVMARLAWLRDHDPKLFAETGVDPIELPPPSIDAITLFPHAVISAYFFDKSH